MIKTKWMKKLLTALCVVAIALAAVTALPVSQTVKADNVSVSNGDFSKYNSDSLAPDSWTRLGDTGENIFSGVYDGRTGEVGLGYELLNHGTDAKDFLVINTKNTSAFSAYESSEIALSANSYYQFTVKAKTSTNEIAFISITGLDQEISLPIVGDGAWTTHKIYLATGFQTTESVKITLSLGKDYAEYSGWVMFDDISAETLTYRDFAAIEKSDNVLTADVNIPYVDGLIKGGDFFVLDNSAWTIGGDKANAYFAIASTNLQIDEEEENATIVIAPNFDGTENNFLHLASKGEESTFVTVTSNEFTVKPDEFYRISYFVLDDGSTKSSGNIANAKLYYKYASNSGEFKSVSATNIQSSNANASHFGWTERAFFVKGSAFADVVCKLEFSIGEEGSPAKGGVFIDDVRVQKLTPEQYASAATDSSVVANADAAISDSTGVTNGAFYSYTVTDGKLVPSGWTKIVAGDSNTNAYGYSSTLADDSEADYEVVKASEPEANIGKYDCALKMYSPVPTAFAMRSSAISVANGKYQLITVSLSNVNVTGNGAAIVIRRTNGAVVAVKESITVAGTYSFCVKGDADESISVYAEIWLGMFDRKQNLDKLASGTIYVKSVSAAESTEAVYNEYAASTSNNQITASVAIEDSWLASDADDNVLSNWTVTSEIKDSLVEYVAEEIGGEKVIRYTNVSPNVSTIKLTPARTITASSYYKVTVQLKIEGSLDDMDANEEGYKGVRAGLITGDATVDTTKYVVSDIKETVLKTDASNYLTVEFFIKGGDADSTVTLFVGIGEKIEVKEGEAPVPYTAGTVYVKGVSFESSTTTEYTDAKNNLKDSQVIVNLSDSDDETEEEETASTGMDTTSLWLMIGSIIFAVAIIIVVIVFFVRKYQKKHPKKAAAIGRASYDRANLNLPDENAKKTDEKSGAVEESENIDKFSDEENAEETETTEDTATTEETDAAEETETTEETATTENTATTEETDNTENKENE